MEPSYQDKTLSQWEFDLKYGEVAERCAAALALAEIGPEKQPVMNALVNGVLDPDKAVQVACAIAIGFIPMEVQSRRNILHDLTQGDEKLRLGWVEILRWTQGSNAASAPTPPAPDHHYASTFTPPTQWEDVTSAVPDIRIPSARYPSRRPTKLPKKKPFVYSAKSLDDEARAYLGEIAANQGEGLPGVFVAREHTASWVDFVPSALLSMVALGSCWIAGYFAPVGAQFFFVLQIALAIIACVLMVHTIRTFRAKRNGIGSFLFVDQEYLWEVGPLSVKVLPLIEVVEARRESSASEDCDDVVLDFGRGIYRLDAIPAESAGQLVTFVREVAMRNSSPEASAEPNGVPTVPLPSFGQFVRRVAPTLAAVVVGIVVAGALILPANAFMREEYLHRKVANADTEDAEPHRAYLAEYPTGRYVGEVHTSLLAVRTAQAKQDRNPGSLWKFLTECDDPPLQAEARKEIKRFYERKADDYRKDATAAQGNPQIVEGFGDLLQLLGSADLLPGERKPVIPITFRGTHEITPVDQLTKFMEDLARADMKNGAVKPAPDGLFKAEAKTKRENLLLFRLNQALSARVSDQFLIMVAKPQAKPTIEIAYHISPSGDFFTWKETSVGGAPPMKNPWALPPVPNFNLMPMAEPVWLVRQYNIDWSITITLPNDGRRFSTGAKIVNTRKTLRWTTKDFSDAKRDPYVFIMDAMDYDLSDQLISSVGLPKQSRPDDGTKDK